MTRDLKYLTLGVGFLAAMLVRTFLMGYLAYLPNSQYWNSFDLDLIDHTLL